MVLFTTDRDRLWEHFRRDPVLFAYHIGDLDDFFFDRCQWAAGYHKSTRIDECLLIYHGGTTPTLLAFGQSERFGPLLSESLDLLPEKFYAHYFSPYREILRSRYREQPLGTHIKMKLEEFHRAHSDDDRAHIRRLTTDHARALLDFYAEAYPGNYFDRRMLATGKYFGYFDSDTIIAVAGVHVCSDTYNIAALGNIATSPKRRGRGLATKVTSVLVSELVDEGRLVALNVKADNAPAIACYRTLGFEQTHEYEEGLFTRK